MKFYIFTIIILVGIVIIEPVQSKMTMDQIKNTLRPMKNACVKKMAIDEALTDGTKKGEFPRDENLMCFMRCVLTMLKMQKNGEILLPVIMTQVDIMMPDEYIEHFKEIFTKCHADVEAIEESCEKSFEFVKCVYTSDPELYFFP